MTARVRAYSADPEDTRLTIYITCAECKSDWGWAADTPENNDKAEDMAARHNVREHNG